MKDLLPLLLIPLASHLSRNSTAAPAARFSPLHGMNDINNMNATDNMNNMNGMNDTNGMDIMEYMDTPETGPFELPELPYAYDALEPYIDEETMRVHHDGHHRSYVDNLNEALAKYPELYELTLEQLLRRAGALPEDIAEEIVNQGGGHYNHTFFWQIMSPEGGGEPTGNLSAAIDRTFGDFESFRDRFKQAALDNFGSGWTWLLKDPSGNLQLASTPNQDTPVPFGLRPIIGIDVWEHAYYLKHRNRRGDYIDDWFNVVDWERANELYNL